MTTTLLAAGASESAPTQMQSARFVAEVMRPGLVDDILGHQRIRDVLSTTKMEIVVQPIVDLQTGKTRFVEALARFVATPPRSADQWFAEAHRVGLGLQLELATVHNAIALLDHLPLASPCVSISVRWPCAPRAFST